MKKKSSLTQAGELIEEARENCDNVRLDVIANEFLQDAQALLILHNDSNAEKCMIAGFVLGVTYQQIKDKKGVKEPNVKSS